MGLCFPSVLFSDHRFGNMHRHLRWGPDKVDLYFYTSSGCGSANQPLSSHWNGSLPQYSKHHSHNTGMPFLSNSLHVFQARM